MMYVTGNTLSVGIREQSVTLLNRHLAMLVDLHAQVKQAHWTVRGPGFAATRDLFARVAEAIGGYSDLVAERTGALGGVAEGTVQVAAYGSPLKPYVLRIADGPSHIRAVAEALAAFGASLRSAVEQAVDLYDTDAADVFAEVPRGDPGTARVFADIAQGVDELLWLLESHLEPVAVIPEKSRQAMRGADRRPLGAAEHA